MKPHGSNITVWDTGQVDVQGVDYGGKLSVAHEEKDVIVLRCASHTRWSGIGQRKYESPRLLVFEVTSYEDVGAWRTLRVRGIVQIDLGRGGTR